MKKKIFPFQVSSDLLTKAQKATRVKVPMWDSPPLAASPAGAGLETWTIPFYSWVGFGLENSILTTGPSMISATAVHPTQYELKACFWRKQYAEPRV